MEERTEQPVRPPIEGEASPPPPLFYWALWIGVFFVILWGMLFLFGANRRSPPPPNEG